MKKMLNSFRRIHDDQGGAALIMVILISLLLVTACAAMLSAVGASSRNNTDALSEAKAYWAAESGLNATINVLRHRTEGDGTEVEYSEAATLPVGNPGDLSLWLAYNEDHRVVVNDEASYEINVSDPDGSGTSTTFNTTGSFAATITSPYEATIVYAAPTPAPSPTVSPEPSPTPTPSPTPPVDYTTITWESLGDNEVEHGVDSPIQALGNFIVSTNGSGGAITDSYFRIDYRMSQPRTGVRSIRGQILGGASPKIKFDAVDFELAGAPIKVCLDASCTAAGLEIPFTPPPAGSPLDINVFVNLIGPTEPWRLKVIATGYGPNGARKQLEGIIQKNFFNDWSSAHAITLVGDTTSGCFVFDPGNSEQVLIDGVSSPSVGVADTEGLQEVVNVMNSEDGYDPFNGTMEPPPAVYGDELPPWLASTYDLDAMVKSLRQTAQNSGRYFVNSNPTGDYWGDFTAGTGITFCEGDCTMDGNDKGGGILIVTGTFYTKGNPKFNGLVLAVGPYRSEEQPGGIERGGGGNELFTGGIIVAPYFPENLDAGFGCPRYIQDGGPGETVNDGLAVTFDNTPTVSNIMRGIAEK